MGKKVVVLHTSFVFIDRERMILDLMAELLPDVALTNIVEDTMLAQVREVGHITPVVTRRMCYYALAAEAMGADAIFNACSSLSPTMNAARQIVNIPIVKIDEGMAEKAATDGHRIGVLATVPTTLDPVIGLIDEKAAALNKSVETKAGLASGAFELLMTGDKARHDDMVVTKAKEVSQWADTLVLAQASMARLAPRITVEIGLPVLTSPRLGVEYLKRVLEQGR